MKTGITKRCCGPEEGKTSATGIAVLVSKLRIVTAGGTHSANDMLPDGVDDNRRIIRLEKR